MFLTAAWCKRQRLEPPLALTVDHALREGSAEEAARVAAWARTRAIPHETLIWFGHKPAANIQARAREERYRLIGEAMRARGLKVLLTGHTENDQAETFLLRLARGSGLDGLSGMAPVAPFPHAAFGDLALARPLLAFSHARLTATLTERGQPWIDDPSNTNDRFARVQIRAAMSSLELAGLTTERIAAAAAHLRRAREAIDAGVAALMAHAVDVTKWGYALLNTDAILSAPQEIALRSLARIVQAFGGAEYPPRFEQTEALLAWLRKSTPRGRTLGGCRLARRTDGKILIAREETALAKENPVVTLKPGATVLWDNRFEIRLSKSAEPCEVRRLGPAGLKALTPTAELPPVEPRRIAAATPALWRGGRLVAAPLLHKAAPSMPVSAKFAALGALKFP